jgi:hypothetical protein
MRGSTHHRQPARLSRDYKVSGRVAQLVEQGIENPRVGGSIPSSATMYSDTRTHFREWVFSFLRQKNHAAEHAQANRSHGA